MLNESVVDQRNEIGDTAKKELPTLLIADDDLESVKGFHHWSLSTCQQLSLIQKSRMS